MCVCTRLLVFLIDSPPSRSSSCPPPANYARTTTTTTTTTADQNVTSPTSTQHSTRQSQLRSSSSWHYQIVVAPNRGPFVYAPFTFSCMTSLRERSGQRQPPEERRICFTFSVGYSFTPE